MPTQLDRALNSKNFFFGFAGLVAASAAWSIFGSDIFPQQADPTGEPENWTEEEMRRWLNSRNLMASSSSTKEELLARVKANMRAPN
ncbi:hypothetical protein D6D01_06803 [Aureobasidium pullulans]|uniref:STE24 endopeptidase n=1 Tax=Aureobasidium pullulans TaxID=5580 RepID=A0A4S9KW79_AURPU|nr:hypothetical protein D6D01_06803 [Aureobasidium pullulans]